METVVLQNIGKALGMRASRSRTLRSETDLIPVIRSRVAAKKVSARLREFQLTEDYLLHLFNISGSTWARRKRGESLMSRTETESWVRYLLALFMAEDVFGSREAALDWLGTENMALGDVRPMDLLDTGIGTDTVIADLQRIEYGVFS